jgi:hypothetical protein
MTQYSLKLGLKKFKEKCKEAMSKEVEQLNLKQIFAPQNAKDLTVVQKSALEPLMFLKEKRNSSIKGRMCAGGRKQREGFNKADATFPTISLESVLIMAAINAFEHRGVAIVNLSGAYPTEDMDDYVSMCLRGRLAEIMVNTSPGIYRKCVSIGSNNTPILYVKLQKALYGCLRSALLFYLKLLADLEDNGFVWNCYDPCVANKVIHDKQFTTTLHVDDLKLSHVNEKEVTKAIDWLKSIYGEDIHVYIGKKHDYLGTDLNYLAPCEVIVYKIDYLERIIDEFPELVVGTSVSPTVERLFTVRSDEERTLLGEKQAIPFHNCVAQLLLASTQARKDIQPAVAFLTTRVQSPDEDEMTKLKRP